MKPPVKIFRWVNRIIGLSVIALVIGGVAFYFWLHSDSGMSWLSEKINQASGERVTVEGLSGRIPFRLQFDRLVLSGDDNENWLIASKAEIKIKGRPLIERKLVVKHLRVDSVRLEKRPDTADDSSSQSPTPDQKKKSAIPLREVRIDQMHIREFYVGTNAIGHEIRGDFSGQATWRPDGLLTAKLQSVMNIDDEIPFAADAVVEFNTDRNHLAVRSLSLSNTWDKLDAQGEWDIRASVLSAEVSAQVDDAGRYAKIIGRDIAGPVFVQAGITRNADNPDYQVKIDSRAPEFRYDATTARDIAVKGELFLGGHEFRYTLDVRSGRIEHQAWVLDSAEFIGNGNWERHEWDVAGHGAYDTTTPFALDAAVVGIRKERADQFTVQVNSLRANWADNSLVSDQYLTYEQDGGSARLEVPGIRINQASASAFLQFQNKQIDALRIEIASLNLAELFTAAIPHAPSITGQAELHADIRDLLTSPTGTIRLVAQDVTIDYGFLHHFDQSTLRLDAQFHHDHVEMQTAAEHPLLDQFECSAEIPVAKGSFLFPLMYNRDGKVSLRIQLAGNLKEISESMISGPAALGGYVMMDITAHGNSQLPQVDGYLHLTNGRYRNVQSGTFLDQIDVRFRGFENNLLLDHATATDGGRGRVLAGGGISFDRSGQTSWTFNGALSNATLFRLIRTDLPLSGDIHATGTNDHARVSGNLWLEPFRFNIPRRLPPSVRELDVVEINHPDPSRNTPTATENAMDEMENLAGQAIDLDIKVKTRRSFEVNGRGLQTEWRGDMHLKGSMRQPRLEGSIRVVRGYAMLLGRRFNLDDGIIDLTGPVPPNPQILASASTRIAGTTARIVVIGTVNRPELSLVSDPLLPEDEIMALILFGKSVETMTPWQAIALANGLRILTGGGGDVVNVIESSQKLMNVDQIEIKQDEEGDGFSSVAVGKYIGHNLYVEGQKGFGDAEDSVTVTLELSPRLVLETETSPGIREGVSLLWRRDF